MHTSYNPCFCIVFLLILAKIAFDSTDLIQSVRILTTFAERAICGIFNAAVDELTDFIFDCRIGLFFLSLGITYYLISILIL